MIKSWISFILSIIAVFVFGYEAEDSKIISEQREKYNIQIMIPEIMESFKTKDPSVLEKYMCQSIKDENPDLTEKLRDFLNLIPGEITEWDWSPSSSSDSSDGNGGVVLLRHYIVEITTTEGEYKLYIGLLEVDTIEPEEAGIRNLEIDKIYPDRYPNNIEIARIHSNHDLKEKLENPKTEDERIKEMWDYIINCLKEKPVMPISTNQGTVL